MQYLIDTQIIIWYYDESLSSINRDLLIDMNNEVLISNISLFEIAIKLGLGKLKLDYQLSELYSLISTSKIKIIDYNKEDVLTYEKLPFHHKDPFDRMIISQAMTRNIPVISSDKAFDNYNIKRIYN